MKPLQFLITLASTIVCFSTLPLMGYTRPSIATEPPTLIAATPNGANVATALRFYEIYNDPTLLGTLPELFAPNYVGIVNGREIPNIQAAENFIRAFQTGFPDAKYVVEDTIIAGDQVVIRWSCTGTHSGSFLEQAPTGRSISVTGITIFQFSHGKISRLWNNWDTFGLLQQLRGT